MLKNRRRFCQYLAMSGAAALVTGNRVLAEGPGGAPASPVNVPWWKSGIMYTVYPRSFQDSNGDGMGDLPGLTSRLGYLQDLGVTGIWITACFASPNVDNGYDVSDYRAIHPAFGTMRDFDTLVAEGNKRGIHIILDMVFNHSSDEHPWFKESRKSRDNPYRDFYFWRDPVDGKPPTNWPSVYGGSGWEYDGVTGQYYLHHYAVKQPDLNWENAKVREELYAVLNFWADRGASGFRFDCAGEISKPLPLRDLPNGPEDDLLYRTSGARLHEYFKEMRAATQKHPDLYFVGEGWGMSRQRIVESTDPKNKELDSAFRMDFALDNIGGDWQDLPWSLTKLKEFNAENSFPDAPDVWPVVFIEDHDFARSVSRYGSRRPEFVVRSAKLLTMMVLSLRGTPFVYQGEELGMSDFPFKDITQYDDISVHNDWRDLVEMGKVTPAEYLANIAHVSRDNSRTPMHWDDSSHAGFTSAKTPWLAVNPNYRSINARSEAADPASMLSFFKNMARIRQGSKALMLGTYKDVSEKDSRVYAYVRSKDHEHRAVILNFSDNSAVYQPPQGVVLRIKLLTNVDGKPSRVGKGIQLAPWEAVLLDAGVQHS